MITAEKLEAFGKELAEAGADLWSEKDGWKIQPSITVEHLNAISDAHVARYTRWIGWGMRHRGIIGRYATVTYRGRMDGELLFTRDFIAIDAGDFRAIFVCDEG